MRLRLLGSFELRGPGDRPLKITARKTRALLAFLALQNGAPQGRDRLAALLWEDADAELARSSLRQALTALRRALPVKMQALIEADAQQVALNLALVQVDVHRLRTLLAEATVDSLAEARRLAAAPLLEGFDARSGAFEEWAAAERRALRRELAAAATKLATLCRDAGDGDGEIDAHAWLLALEPLAENVHRELMACYARAGRYTEALRQYQILRTLLRRELDLAPDPATEALYRELMKKRRAGAGGPLYAMPGAEPEDAVASALAAEAPSPAAQRMIACCRRASCWPCACPASPRNAARSTRKRRASWHNGCRDSSMRPSRITAASRTGSRETGWSRCSGSRTSRATSRSGRCAPRRRSSMRSARATSRPARRRPASRRARCCRPASTGRSRSRATPMSDAESLAGQANPGEVLLSAGLRRALGVHNLPFAGRHAELSLMNSLLDRCVTTRRGRTIVTRGEAGIGKSRLLEAFMEAARTRGVACHRVQVLDFGQVKARRPLAALFASLLGVAADAVPPSAGARSSRRSSPGACRRTASCTRAAWSARRCPPTRHRSSATSIPRRSSTAGWASCSG